MAKKGSHTTSRVQDRPCFRTVEWTRGYRSRMVCRRSLTSSPKSTSRAPINSRSAVLFTSCRNPDPAAISHLCPLICLSMQILQQMDAFNKQVPDFNNYLAYILACGTGLADEVSKTILAPVQRHNALTLVPEEKTRQHCLLMVTWSPSLRFIYEAIVHTGSAGCWAAAEE